MNKDIEIDPHRFNLKIIKLSPEVLGLMFCSGQRMVLEPFFPKGAIITRIYYEEETHMFCIIAKHHSFPKKNEGEMAVMEHYYSYNTPKIMTMKHYLDRKINKLKE
jgi:hypothetical protein